ncbi:hypothetical protein J6590_044707 [Homalodisca vitripennis]|nr:hypothetical protein J6590_044707 [Homalodisca vitripennis]
MVTNKGPTQYPEIPGPGQIIRKKSDMNMVYGLVSCQIMYMALDLSSIMSHSMYDLELTSVMSDVVHGTRAD